MCRMRTTTTAALLVQARDMSSVIVVGRPFSVALAVFFRLKLDPIVTCVWGATGYLALGTGPFADFVGGQHSRLMTREQQGATAHCAPHTSPVVRYT